MRELGADAAEILPHAGEDRLDLLRRLVGKRRRQVGAPDLVLGQPGPTMRIRRPKKFAMRRRFMRRNSFSAATVTAPIAASVHDFKRRAGRAMRLKTSR